ncbi:MAG: hypothetical protein WAR79_11795 [Melioribacteraceae bacterium]
MKAIIIYHTNALEPAHSEAVKTAFINGGGINADIYLITNFDQAVLDYARNNNYDAIIYSYENLSSFLELAENNTDIMIFMPTHLSYANQIQQLVVTESEHDLQNGEYEFKDTTQNKDSYSNGYICGQLFKIAELKSCSLQDSRYLANKTKDENGFINITSAINYYSENLIDEPREIEIEYLDFYEIKVKCGLVRDAIEYEMLIVKENNYFGEKERIIELSDSQERFIKYRAIRGNNISVWSELFKIYPLDKRRKEMGKVSMFSQVGVRRKELVEDVPTAEGQKYVSKIVNGEMQMVKVPDMGYLIGQFSREAPELSLTIIHNTIGEIDSVIHDDSRISIFFTNPIINDTDYKAVILGYQDSNSKLMANIIWNNTVNKFRLAIELDTQDDFEDGGMYLFAIGMVKKYNNQSIYM